MNNKNFLHYNLKKNEKKPNFFNLCLPPTSPKLIFKIKENKKKKKCKKIKKNKKPVFPPLNFG